MTAPYRPPLPEPAAPLPIGAILYRSGEAVDHLLLALRDQLVASGWRVHGLVQAKSDSSAGSCDLSLVDLASQRIYPISQQLGSLSTACCLDLGGLTEASTALRGLSPDNADLVIVNRFAGLEASGQGFAAEMLDLMSRAVPLLTVVPEKHLAAWQDFTGGLATLLPPNLAALQTWATGLHRMPA